MSRIVFPDTTNTEWIAWKKIGRRSAGIENSKFRCTSERFSDNSTTLPFINISPLNIGNKPLNTTKKSYPRTINHDLLIKLPPFSGSIKARNITNLFTKIKNPGQDVSNNLSSARSELVPKANFLIKPKSKSKNISKKKIKKIIRNSINKNDKLEGIIGIKLLHDSFLNEQDSMFVKNSEGPKKNQTNGEFN
ncbi:hypothetical protein SteCoe_34630 [Stentor coeruleus]|uniref:Uncharacterized protein n=1 Tax=Stentor coeruleus TaxID=5963 RepID=A0A1R2AU42_9CILI|nr:hypothetical protein SteCoe_34630 [Stentor coeruleus]